MSFFYVLKLSLNSVPQKVILFLFLLLPRSLTNTYRRILFLRKSQTYNWSFTKTEVPFIGIWYLCLQVQTFSFRIPLSSCFQQTKLSMRKNNAYTGILGCKVRIKVLMLTYFSIAIRGGKLVSKQITVKILLIDL